MSQVKILEVRDHGTFKPVLCVDVGISENEGQRYLMRRVGFPIDGRPNIIMTALDANGEPAWNDPYGWNRNTRTMPVAHHWIIDHWSELKDGDVVCVETILGEREVPKISERYTAAS